MRGFSIREHAPSILVATLSSTFGVALLQGTDALATLITHDRNFGASEAVGVALAAVALVFIAIATYVGAVVTANTFATIIAGRTRTIALLRLIGASARSQRSAVAREGFVVGLIGAALGALAGTAVTAAILGVASLTGYIPWLDFSFLEPVLAIPVVGVVLTTWIASWVGSRRVLTVSPMQAIGASHERSAESVAHRRGRNAVALVLVMLGTILLGLGILAGLVTPAGVLIGVVGGMLSFTGVVLGAQLIMPRALRLVGRLLGRSPSARLAAENAVRYPERSTRTTIGIVIGVTLITMFAVAGGTFQALFDRLLSGQDGADEASQTIDAVVGIFSVLIGFSALIAAVGLVNNLSLSVLQRIRELGLLRALGFTARQLRGMITAEGAQLTAAAVLVGLVLGTAYGWAGAQSMLALVTGSPSFVVPVVPPLLLVLLVVGAAAVTVVASIAPSRRATRVSPVTALAVE
ncbi:FtsX-like permease family protein [Schumannella luteola]